MLLLALLACTATDGTPTATDTEAGTDTESQTGSDTEDTELDASFEVEVALSEYIETVLLVSFTADVEGDGWVRFGPEGAEGWKVSATATEDGWEATLVGVRPETLAFVQAGVDSSVAETVEITTGSLPDWVDTLDHTEGDPTPGFLVTTLINDAVFERGAAIFDETGRPVWAYALPDEASVGLTTRTRLSADHSELKFNSFFLEAEGGAMDGTAQIVTVSLDGSSYSIDDIPYNHHDFDWLDDGTLVWLDIDEKEVDGLGTLRGDKVYERTVDGVETSYGSTWDAFPEAAEDPESAVHPESWWSLANHLDVDEENDRVMYSTRNLDSLVMVERSTGEIQHVIGTGPDADVVPDDPFDGQHGFLLDGEELMVFDNAPERPGGSRVVRYQLDFDAGTATKDWEYSPGDSSFVLGDIVALPDDRLMVIVTTSGLVQEVDEEGEVLSEFQHPNTFFPYVEWYTQIGLEP